MQTKQPYTLNKYLIKRRCFPRLIVAFFLKLESSAPIGLSQSQHLELLPVGPFYSQGCVQLSAERGLTPKSFLSSEGKRWGFEQEGKPTLLIPSPAHSCESNCISVEDPLNGLTGMSVLIQATPVAATDSISGIAGSMHSIHPHFVGRGVLRECFEWNPEAGGFKLH